MAAVQKNLSGEKRVLENPVKNWGACRAEPWARPLYNQESLRKNAVPQRLSAERPWVEREKIT